MATIYELRTFKDLQDAVAEELGIPSSDSVMRNRIKRDLNAVYLQEVVPFSNWWWARGHVDVQQDPYIDTGTVEVTQGSVDITFSSAPAASHVGSKIRFNNESEVYTIAEHTAGSTTAKLSVRFIESSDTDASYKLWRNAIALPSDCRETYEVTHNFLDKPMEGIGIQELRRIERQLPYAENRPRYYSTSDFKDADPYASISGLPAISTRSSGGYLKSVVFAATIREDSTDSTSRRIDVGDRIRVASAGNFTYNGDFIVASVTTTTVTDDTIQFVGKTVLSESSTADATMTIQKENPQVAHRQYRELLIYPSVFDTRTNLSVDYIKLPEPMIADGDEPIIPIGDRIVLVHGTLQRGWVKARNEQTASINAGLFKERLSKMKGDLQDSSDHARLIINKRYLATKRSALRNSETFDAIEFGSGGGSGGSSPTITSTANRAAIFNSSGELIASSDISTTELGQLDGILSAAVGISDSQTLTNKTINADDNSISNLEHGAEVDDPTSGVHGVAGSVVGTSDSQTLTNKTITLSTASRALVTNGSSNITESDITSTELTYLNDFVPLTSVALNDNETGPTAIFSYAHGSFESGIIEYSIARGSGNREVGRLMVATDGTSVNMTQDASTLGTIGVTLTAAVNGANIEIRYSSTSTGTAPTFNYLMRRWT